MAKKEYKHGDQESTVCHFVTRSSMHYNYCDKCMYNIYNNLREVVYIIVMPLMYVYVGHLLQYRPKTHL